MNLQDALVEVATEVHQAIKKYPSMPSPHDGYAIVLEELDELWEVVKQKNKTRDGTQGQDKEAMRREAKQVAAMALRFMVDLT